MRPIMFCLITRDQNMFHRFHKFRIDLSIYLKLLHQTAYQRAALKTLNLEGTSLLWSKVAFRKVLTKPS